MPDATAGMLFAVLVLVAVTGLHQREALQPNRAGAALYLSGAVAWGVALIMLWAAWAGSHDGAVCPEGSCDALVETIEGSGAHAGEFLVGPETLGGTISDVTD